MGSKGRTPGLVTVVGLLPKARMGERRGRKVRDRGVRIPGSLMVAGAGSRLGAREVDGNHKRKAVLF